VHWKNHEFVVFYQPKYGLSDNQIAGAEALVRWKHPERGMISPGEFIPVFERNGFITLCQFYLKQSAWNPVTVHQIADHIHDIFVVKADPRKIDGYRKRILSFIHPLSKLDAGLLQTYNPAL